MGGGLRRGVAHRHGTGSPCVGVCVGAKWEDLQTVAQRVCQVAVAIKCLPSVDAATAATAVGLFQHLVAAGKCVLSSRGGVSCPSEKGVRARVDDLQPCLQTATSNRSWHLHLGWRRPRLPGQRRDNGTH